MSCGKIQQSTKKKLNWIYSQLQSVNCLNIMSIDIKPWFYNSFYTFKVTSEVSRQAFNKYVWTPKTDQ